MEIGTGDFEAGLARAESALGPVVAAGAGMALPTLLATRAYALAAAGRLDEAAGAFRATLPELVGDVSTIAFCHARLAAVLRLQGDAAAAEAAARAADDAASSMGAAMQVSLARRELAQAALADGRLADAERHTHEAIAACAGVLELSDALDTLAEIATARAEDDDAARLLGAAAGIRERGLVVRWVTEQTRLDALEAELRGRFAEFDAAHAAGAALDRAAVLEWIGRTRGSRKRPPGGWESLTPTERQVVELAAEGLTNPQIGERMFITRGTVKIHLSHVYAKLELKNRSELTAVAVRRQATPPAAATSGAVRGGTCRDSTM